MVLVVLRERENSRTMGVQTQVLNNGESHLQLFFLLVPLKVGLLRRRRRKEVEAGRMWS